LTLIKATTPPGSSGGDTSSPFGWVPLPTSDEGPTELVLEVPGELWVFEQVRPLQWMMNNDGDVCGGGASGDQVHDDDDDGGGDMRMMLKKCWDTGC